MSLPVKEFWKSVNIWGSYEQEFGVSFFWDSVVVAAAAAAVVVFCLFFQEHFWRLL